MAKPKLTVADLDGRLREAHRILEDSLSSAEDREYIRRINRILPALRMARAVIEAARLVRVDDGPDRDWDADLIRQLEAAAKTCDSSLLEAAHLRLKRYRPRS
jgi:hypothetical protein